MKAVAEILVADGSRTDQAGRRIGTDVIGDDIAVCRSPALHLAVFLGGGLAAPNTPVNAEVKAHAVEFRLVVSYYKINSNPNEKHNIYGIRLIHYFK